MSNGIPKAPNDDYGLVQACRELHSVIDSFDAIIAQKVSISRNDLRCLNLLEKEPLLSKQIAEKLGLTSGSVTALQDRLEKRRLIRRKPHPEDRRAILVELTPTAHAQLGSLYRMMGESIVLLSDNYGKQKAQNAVHILNDLSERFESVIQRVEKNP
ncbi:MAG: MarR family transcriptional regulator [Verrucomicrobiota bacterium]